MALESSAYIWLPSPTCFKLLRHDTRRVFSLAFAKAGNSIAARIAMMAMTTSNSMSVNPKSFLDALKHVFKHATISRERRGSLGLLDQPEKLLPARMACCNRVVRPIDNR